MALKRMRILALFLSLAMLLGPSAAFPCGPMFPAAVFSLTSRPDGPYQNFLRGDLGVLQPGFRSYDLVPAYRYLTGIGLNQEEQRALLGEPYGNAGAGQEEDWVQNWLDARNQVNDAEAPPQIGWHSRGSSSIYRTETKNGYYSYLNCGEDAFKTAIKTLNERVRMFGKQGPEITDWVKAQDMVFSNCSKGRSIPDPAVPGNNPLLKADREYQIAAANFYSGDFDQSEKLFNEISQDKTSQWSTIAPYLAARSLVRNANMKAGFQKVEMSLMSRAESVLQSILQNSSVSRYHKPAQDLLGYVTTRLRPAERLHEIALLLSKKDAGPRLMEYLQDFRYMLMNTNPETQKAAMELDDLTDWVLTFQNQRPDPLGRAIERWEKTRSQAWLIAVISKMPAGHPKQQQVQTEADKLFPTAPGYQTAVYHSIRLLVDSGKQDVAKKRLDALLAENNRRFSGSGRNLLLGIRMGISAGLDEFLQYAQRVPAAVGYGYETELEYTDEKVEQEYAGQKMLDRDSVGIVNGYLPLNMLADIASRPVLAYKVRRDIAFAAWLRAVLLDNEQYVKNSNAVLSAVAPEMQEQLAGYVDAATKQESRFIASYITLKNPGIKPFISPGIGRTTPLDKIDNFRNNWWCALGDEMSAVRGKRGPEGKSGNSAAYPVFLTKKQVQETEREIEALQKVESAPNYLAEIVLPWAETNPDDPRVPEALHLLVKATRYGCTDTKTSAYSKAAFRLLHKRYPNNKWTKETPYYY